MKFDYQQQKLFSYSQKQDAKNKHNQDSVNNNNTYNNTYEALILENIIGANFNNKDSNLLNDNILPFNNNHILCQNSNQSTSFFQKLKNYEPSQSCQKPEKIRVLPKLPERVLDAPELSDDFYLNILDWSQKNILAIVLGPCIYLWNSETGQNSILTESSENVSSINWMNSGTCLAVGLGNGAVQLWDICKNELLRTMPGHLDRVSALSWSEYTLSSGSRDSKIFNHDVRIKSHVTSTYLGHKYEICGLKWSPDGTQLASGGGDNKICIWDVNRSSNINALLHEMQHEASSGLVESISNIDENLREPLINRQMINTNNSVNMNFAFNHLNLNDPNGDHLSHLNLSNQMHNLSLFNRPNNQMITNNSNSLNNSNNSNANQYLSRHINGLRDLGILLLLTLKLIFTLKIVLILNHCISLRNIGQPSRPWPGALLREEFLQVEVVQRILQLRFGILTWEL